MENSKSDNCLLWVCVAENQYLHETVEWSIVQYCVHYINLEMAAVLFY